MKRKAIHIILVTLIVIISWRSHIFAQSNTPVPPSHTPVPPSNTPTVQATSAPTETPKPTSTATPSEPTATVKATAAPTAKITKKPVLRASPTDEPTNTPKPTSTPTVTPTPTPPPGFLSGASSPKNLSVILIIFGIISLASGFYLKKKGANGLKYQA